jgi:uncharacterized protein (UPF0335 family)
MRTQTIIDTCLQVERLDDPAMTRAALTSARKALQSLVGQLERLEDENVDLLIEITHLRNQLAVQD